MIDAVLGEFARESEVTRRLLERVPEEKLVWKPHDRSPPVYGPTADESWG